MEMVKEDIIYSKTRKGIEHCAKNSIILIFYITAQEGITAKSRQCKFEHEHRRHQVGHNSTWERQHQPEKRAAEHIKAVGAYYVCAKVGGIAPADIPIQHRIMYHLMEGDLLHVIVAVEEEITVIIDHPGQKTQESYPECPKEGPQKVILLAP